MALIFKKTWPHYIHGLLFLNSLTSVRNFFALKVISNLFFRDLNKIQEGIGEKVTMFVFYMSTCCFSLISAFVHGWQLTLVILSVFPFLGLSTGLIAKVFMKAFNFYLNFVGFNFLFEFIFF